MKTANSVRRSALLSAFAACLFARTSFAQGTLADYQRAERFLPGNLRQLYTSGEITPHWLGHTSRFWYRHVRPASIDYVLVDPARNTAGPLFDNRRLAGALSHAANRNFDPNDLRLPGLEVEGGGKILHFSEQDTRFTCNLEKYQCSAESLSSDRYESRSPNGLFAAFVKDHNLYVRDIATAETIQLTSDGIPGDDYATPLPSLREMVEQQTEDVKQRPAVFWSPDSAKLITYRLDSRNAGRFTSLQYVPPAQLRPKVFTCVYPLPGEVLPKAMPVIFDLQSGKRIDVDTPPLEIQFQGGPRFEWLPDNRHIRYQYEARGMKSIEIRLIDADTGKQQTLLREESQQYVDPGETFFRFDAATGEILWTSERDGWNHLYLATASGQLENRITHGDWVVRGIAYVDDKNRRVYFLASGKEPNEDPYQLHLYVVNFDGSGLKLLSPENANHSVSVSPDGAFFVDSYSRPDAPGQSVLRRTTDGSEVRVLERDDITGLLKAGWKHPEPFQGVAADQTTKLYGLIWFPSNFNPAKKYPVIEQIYTGPQGFFVPKSLPAALRSSEQSMAELGFIVVMIDGRGTSGRSRAFHLFSYRNLGGVFEDHVAMIRQMAERHPYMDLTRVGIYGTSAGGYGAAHAFLQYPDFYKVCVSISGDHDARLDKAWWNELYQGYPLGPDYAAQSNEAIAANLKGHLLLEHGDVDENVHPVETMRLVNALIKANKNFDMLFVPNMFHGEGRNLYLYRRRWDYFVQYLLGVTPPADFAIQEQQPVTDRPGL